MNNRTLEMKEKVTPLSNSNIVLPAYSESKHLKTYTANRPLQLTRL